MSVGALFNVHNGMHFFLQTMRNNIQSLVKIVWEMNLKNLPGLSIKNIFGNPSLADVDNDFFLTKVE